MTFCFTGSFTKITVGCGRFFEGTAEEMDAALNKTLAALPDDTKVYVRPAYMHRDRCIAK